VAVKGRVSLPVATVLAAAPVIIWLQQPSWVHAHQVLADGGALLWELLIAIFGFVTGLFSKTVGKLQEIWSDKAAEAVDGKAAKLAGSLAGSRRRYERAYRGYIAGRWGTADLDGLPNPPPTEAKLDAIFVDVILDRRALTQMPSGMASHGADVESTGGRKSIWDFLLAVRDPKNPVIEAKKLVIIGAPGSGKTTLLRHVALELARKSRKDAPRTLPVLLQLKDCVAQINDNPRVSLPEVINASLKDYVDPPADWFKEKLGKGQCAVLLDGLDEVPGLADRQLVATWVANQRPVYPGNDFVVTSRPQGYRDNQVRDSTLLQLRELTGDQVKLFITRWYAETGPQDMTAAWDTADELIRRLDPRFAAAPALADLAAYPLAVNPLADLAANPLFLMMIFTVYRYNRKNGRLPDSRAGLYAEMCEVSLEKRARQVLPLPKGKAQAALGELAWAMMKQGIKSIPRATAADGIAADGSAKDDTAKDDTAKDDTAEAVISPALGGAMDPAAFLESVQANGLLVEDDGCYSFAHLTFQEFLAADACRGDDRVAMLVASLGEPEWREVALLRAARHGAGPMVKAALASGALPRLMLAVECADADRKLAQGLRLQVTELLLDAANPSVSPARRKLAAALTADRQLRQTVKLDSGTRVCVLPVSRQLYDLYNYEKFQAYPVWAPGAAPGGPVSQQAEPMLGIPAAEATEFVDWLNTLFDMAGGGPGHGPVYRLPTRAEAEDPVFRDLPAIRQRGVWVSQTGGPAKPSLWCRADFPHPYAVTAWQLRERADADLAGPAGTEVAVGAAFALTQSLAVSAALATSPGAGNGRVSLAAQIAGSLKLAMAFGDDLVNAVTPGPQGGRHEILRESLKWAVHDASGPELAALLAGNGTQQAQAVARNLGLARASDLKDVLEAVLMRDTGISVPRPADRASPGVDLGRALDARLDAAFLANADVDLALCAIYARGQLARDSHGASGQLFGAALDTAIDEQPERAIVPDALPFLVREANARVMALVPADGTDCLHRRSAAVAAAIVAHVGTLDERDLATVDAVVPGIRLGALAVAAACCQLGAPLDLVQQYVDIAAAITAAERRAIGEIPPSEIIVLVRG
jgi:hypothetical protein